MTGQANTRLISAVRSGLRELADPARAEGARSYMKSTMSYYGVTAAQQRQVYKRVFSAYLLHDSEDWQATILLLWRKAKFREERYAAIELSGFKPYRAFQKLDTLSMYEEMIVRGAWWDYVDAVAIHRVGAFLLKDHPSRMSKQLRNWSGDRNMWKRRASIISQVSFKADTDLELLYDCIEPNLEDKEFFIRKAIGWALRSYAWVDPDEIVRYTAHVGSRMSNLSRREALKNIRI